MRRSFSGSGMGGGSGGGSGMLRSVHRALRSGVGGAPPEPFSASANSTTIATANSRKPKNFNKQQSAPPNTALTLSPGGPNKNNNNNPNNNNGPSAAFSSLINLPKSDSSPTCSEDMEWECLDANEEERVSVFYEDFVFGTVPSRDEVNYAISALQQVLEPSYLAHFPKEKLTEDTWKEVENEDNRTEGIENMISSSESEVDWVEPSVTLCNSRMLRPYGSDRVYDAFHMLQSEPSVQRMVLSLSSDKAVWDAVLNNEVVKELRGSISQGNQSSNVWFHISWDLLADEQGDRGSDDSNPIKDILSWVFVNAKGKIIQLIDKITNLVNEVFQHPNEEKKGSNVDPLEGKLKTSLFLSIIVLLIVVVTRAQSA
ncbi:hypothetical protein DH2020_010146 [Rehmannia glutinosa]|uniref:Uncharacterized protein n=1 Tax=Rehmannia glutinosa TaxID=99300 RepID=A0ABR0X942_REHGL